MCSFQEEKNQKMIEEVKEKVFAQKNNLSFVEMSIT